jgi:hypothetical protein
MILNSPLVSLLTEMSCSLSQVSGTSGCVGQNHHWHSALKAIERRSLTSKSLQDTENRVSKVRTRAQLNILLCKGQHTTPYR